MDKPKSQHEKCLSAWQTVLRENPDTVAKIRQELDGQTIEGKLLDAKFSGWVLGIGEYAYMKDGVRVVGDGTTTLEEAIAKKIPNWQVAFQLQ